MVEEAEAVEEDVDEEVVEAVPLRQDGDEEEAVERPKEEPHRWLPQRAFPMDTCQGIYQDLRVWWKNWTSESSSSFEMDAI